MIINLEIFNTIINVKVATHNVYNASKIIFFNLCFHVKGACML